MPRLVVTEHRAGVCRLHVATKFRFRVPIFIQQDWAKHPSLVCVQSREFLFRQRSVFIGREFSATAQHGDVPILRHMILVGHAVSNHRPEDVNRVKVTVHCDDCARSRLKHLANGFPYAEIFLVAKRGDKAGEILNVDVGVMIIARSRAISDDVDADVFALVVTRSVVLCSRIGKTIKESLVAEAAGHPFTKRDPIRNAAARIQKRRTHIRSINLTVLGEVEVGARFPIQAAVCDTAQDARRVRRGRYPVSGHVPGRQHFRLSLRRRSRKCCKQKQNE